MFDHNRFRDTYASEDRLPTESQQDTELNSCLPFEPKIGIPKKGPTATLYDASRETTRQSGKQYEQWVVFSNINVMQ